MLVSPGSAAKGSIPSGLPVDDWVIRRSQPTASSAAAATSAMTRSDALTFILASSLSTKAFSALRCDPLSTSGTQHRLRSVRIDVGCALIEDAITVPACQAPKNGQLDDASCCRQSYSRLSVTRMVT